MNKPVVHIAGPSALMMTPLLGLTFHSDQRIMMYWLAGAFRSNLFAFEVLNARGTPLSAADLIKNNILHTATGEGCAEELHRRHLEVLHR